MNTPPDSSISRKASLMRRRPTKQVIALALAAGAAVATFAPYAAAQLGRLLKVDSIDKPKPANTPVPPGSDPKKIDDTDELITQVIPLQGADAIQLKQDLTPLMSADADFPANASSNSLILTDT